MNRHGCWLPADGAAMAARSSRSTVASSTGWSVYLRMLRRLRTGSSMLTSGSRGSVAREGIDPAAGLARRRPRPGP